MHRIRHPRIALCFALAAAITTSASAQTVAPGFYLPPSAWDLKLPAASRFVVLSNFDNQAVLDIETGLVWERSAGDINADGVVNPTDLVLGTAALLMCAEKRTGGRMGWRLPAFNELTSLMETTGGQPRMPAGHPFVSPATDAAYWTSTTPSFAQGNLMTMLLSQGLVQVRVPQISPGYSWCVRGSASPSMY